MSLLFRCCLACSLRVWQDISEFKPDPHGTRMVPGLATGLLAWMAAVGRCVKRKTWVFDGSQLDMLILPIMIIVCKMCKTFKKLMLIIWTASSKCSVPP